MTKDEREALEAHLKGIVQNLPEKPGSYQYYDDEGTIIYVGKAKNLKRRVSSYFNKEQQSRKTALLVSKIRNITYTVVNSEEDALLLENSLIKQYKPRYNVLLKDDKTYPYIKVTVREPFPRIFMTRQMKKDKAKYFGPFSSSQAVRKTLDFMYRAFQLRDCKRVLPRDIGKERPCLNYHIHQCGAPCAGYMGEKAYRANVDAALDFLNGKFEPTVRKLKDEMEDAATRMEFERAGELRDLLRSIEHIEQRQKVTSEGMEDRDIIALGRDEREAVVQVFFVREGRIVGREHHYLHIAMEDESRELLESFVKQFYAGTPFIPQEIWLQEELTDSALLTDWLSAKRGARVRLVVPKKGEKEKLMELAARNADMVLEKDRQRLQMDEARNRGAVHELEELTGLRNLHRMEAYDISNISGTLSVGSMVVYEDGKPKKSDYRKFRIQTVIGPNDYASLREVLTRRFQRSLAAEDGNFVKLPDLILMDGGRGQVNIALEVLECFNLQIPVCGMVKDDQHRTRGLWYRGAELPISERSEGFKLVTRIQDEAHRFAIEYHRSLRSKAEVHSVLDDIPGIGAVRRKTLLRQYGGVEGVRAASVEELSTLPSFNLRVAEEVYRYFHRERSQEDARRDSDGTDSEKPL